jgi:hypothetical protein
MPMYIVPDLNPLARPEPTPWMQFSIGFAHGSISSECGTEVKKKIYQTQKKHGKTYELRENYKGAEL